nr:imidazole glycerol phosphate synthase subunit HisH [Lachnospiraceae bacterium]
GLVPVIQETVKRKIPFLGICLGLQLMFEESEESPGVAGLGLMKGKILRIPKTEGLKVPHMGWNSLHFTKKSELFKGIREESYVYFVHSYYLKADDPSVVAAVTQYGTQIHAAVENDHLFACQFHPEKSSDTGMQILHNFISL